MFKDKQLSSEKQDVFKCLLNFQQLLKGDIFSNDFVKLFKFTIENFKRKSVIIFEAKAFYEINLMPVISNIWSSLKLNWCNFA